MSVYGPKETMSSDASERVKVWNKWCPSFVSDTPESPLKESCS